MDLRQKLTSLVIDDDDKTWSAEEDGYGIPGRVHSSRTELDIAQGRPEIVYETDVRTITAVANDVVGAAKDKRNILDLRRDVYWIDIRNDEKKFEHVHAKTFLDNLVEAYPSSRFVIVSGFIYGDGKCSKDIVVKSIYESACFKSQTSMHKSHGRMVLSKNQRMSWFTPEPDNQDGIGYQASFHYVPKEMCLILRELELVASFSLDAIHMVPVTAKPNGKSHPLQAATELLEYLNDTVASTYAGGMPVTPTDEVRLETASRKKSSDTSKQGTRRKARNDRPPGTFLVFARNGRYLLLQKKHAASLLNACRYRLEQGKGKEEPLSIFKWRAVRATLRGEPFRPEKLGIGVSPFSGAPKAAINPLGSLFPPCSTMQDPCFSLTKTAAQFLDNFPEVVVHLPPSESGEVCDELTALANALGK